MEEICVTQVPDSADEMSFIYDGYVESEVN